MKSVFEILASKIIPMEIASKCSEANIILQFGWGFVAYRTVEVRDIMSFATKLCYCVVCWTPLSLSSSLFSLM